MVAKGVRTADGGRPNWYLPLAGAIDGPEAALPVDPYVLGCWLGGSISAAGERTVRSIDAAHFTTELEHRGYLAGCDAGPAGGARRSGPPGRQLSQELRRAGLAGTAPAHVPGPYLRASAKQRLALLQGLMDAKGTVTAGS